MTRRDARGGWRKKGEELGVVFSKLSSARGCMDAFSGAVTRSANALLAPSLARSNIAQHADLVEFCNRHFFSFRAA